MENQIKIGAVSWGLPGGGLFAPRIAKQAGLDGIQLELGSYENGYPLSQKVVTEAYLEEAEKYHIEYPSLVLNDLMVHEFINGRNTECGKIAYEQIAIGIEAAVKLHIGAVMLPNFERNFITTLDHIENTIEALIYSCEIAAQKGIVILTETALDWRIQKKLMDKVGRANLQLFFDSMNYKFFSDLEQCEELKALYERMIPQLHTKDGIYLPGSKQLGEGKMDFAAQMECLKKLDYAGWIIIENYYNQLSLRNENKQDQLAGLTKDIKAIRNQFFIR